MTFILIAYFDWLLGPQKGKIFEKIFKNLLLITVCFMKLILCINVPGISLYKKLFLFQSDKNSGCYGNFQFPWTYNGKSENLLFLQSHWRYLNFIFREMFIE